MNWQRAKSQLIIILIILNLILLGFWAYDYISEVPYRVSDETLEEFEELLLKNNIKLDASIPDEDKPLGTLIVKYQESSGKDISRRFFGGKGIIEDEEGYQKILNDDKEITIINNRRLIYENLDQDLYKNGSPGSDNDKLCEEFLKEMGFETDDMVLSSRIVEDDKEILEYTKVYGDMLIETSYTRLMVKNEEIRSMDRLWIDVLEESDRKVKLDPSYKALLSFVGRTDLEEKTITDINQCYYFDPEAQGILEDNTRAERGRAVPAWRVEFSDGTVEVVDNF